MSLLVGSVFFLNQIIIYTWQFIVNIYNWRATSVILSAARGIQDISRLHSPSPYTSVGAVEIT